MNKMAEVHLEYKVSDTGFFINCDAPYLGATLDAVSSCVCCGKGVIEIKCPYCKRSGLDDSEDVQFCLEVENDHKALKKNHPYYFQVQLQMHVCSVSHADFVISTEKTLLLTESIKMSLLYQASLTL